MSIPKKNKYIGKYDSKLKIAIVQEYLNTTEGYGALSKKYNIPIGTIRHFIGWYKEKYPTGTPKGIAEASPPVGGKQPSEKDLQIIALQMLIENASKELGVDIVKKFGTKQQKK
jgi:hypothetical protein